MKLPIYLILVMLLFCFACSSPRIYKDERCLFKTEDQKIHAIDSLFKAYGWNKDQDLTDVKDSAEMRKNILKINYNEALRYLKGSHEWAKNDSIQNRNDSIMQIKKDFIQGNKE